MGKTLQQARDTVVAHLDEQDADVSDPRFSTVEQDRALQYGLSACLRDYVDAGGNRFDTVENINTTSAGLISFATGGRTSPLAIRGVSLIQGSRAYPIVATLPEDRRRDATGVRTLQIRWVRDYAIPGSVGDPLVGVGSVAADSWFSFEEWVCARAALYLAVKDNEANPALLRLESESRTNSLTAPIIPRGRPFPRRPHFYSTWYLWMWVPNLQRLQLVEKVI